MGGGGGWSFSSNDLGKIKEKVKDRIQEAKDAVKRNVFISFASEDLNQVNLLRGQAQNQQSGLEFNDWSLQEPFDSKQADYIRRGIRERIRQSSVTLVFLSAHTGESKWVDWEIRESVALGKRVIAMYSGDKPPKTIPGALTAAKVKPVPWSHELLQKAIGGK